MAGGLSSLILLIVTLMFPIEGSVSLCTYVRSILMYDSNDILLKMYSKRLRER